MKQYPIEVVLSVSTGRLMCPFSDMHELIEYLVGHPVFTHELANKWLADELKDIVHSQHPVLKTVDAESINKHNWEAKRDELRQTFGYSIGMQPMKEAA